MLFRSQVMDEARERERDRTSGQYRSLTSLVVSIATITLFALGVANIAVRATWQEAEDAVYWADRPDGVVVAEVADGSPAARVGFQKGDLVLDVNGRKIDKTATLAAVANESAGLWRLTVSRGGEVVRMALR